MTDSYLFQQGRRSFATLRTGLLFGFALFVATSAQAQDTGNAGFWNTMSVATGGGTLGASSLQ